MNRIIFCRLVFVALVFVPVRAYSQQLKLSDLSWLAGCWEMKNEKRGLTITEMWMKPAGDAMIGVGRTVRANKVVDFEFLRIVEDPTGLSYISRPSANKEDTAFKLTKSAANELMFENLAHDFPQRIIYKASGDRLTARIEGTSNGKTRGTEFPYSRVRCE